ncbi:MAG: sensor domain-containing diguanylate cyclase [Treponema sp.]|nr:sensor domain-containing diguanylate cyclase [Treponema sp.]
MQADKRGIKQKFTSSRVIATVTAVVSAVIWLVAIQVLHQTEVAREKSHAKSLLSTVTYTMQMSLQDYFSIIHFWSTYILQHGSPDVHDFYQLCESLYHDGKALVSIALAPDGVVTYNYPENGPSILGMNLFSDPVRSSDALWSKITMQTTLTGPISSNFSGMVFEIRTPVYVPAADGSRKFWGFALVAIKEVPFFESSRIPQLTDDGYDYQLKRINAQYGKLELVSCSTPRVFENAVSVMFPLENTAWTLLLEPHKGWAHKNTWILTLLVAVSFTLLISFASASFWQLFTNERSFKRMAYVDSLTGLYNTRKFYEDMSVLEKQMKPYAVLYLDLNDFKPVNDNFGHKAGDQLLSIVALKLQRCVRGDTGVYRIGGDEFTIIIPNAITMEALENLCLRIKGALLQKITLQNAVVRIGTSIGYSRCPEDGFRYSEIIQKAEAIMYADKKQQHAKR